MGVKIQKLGVASLLLSMESCFSVLSGWIILGETLSAREGIGCVLMFVAIILAQHTGLFAICRIVINRNTGS